MPRFRRLRRPSRKASPKIDQEPAAAATEETTPELTAEESPEPDVEVDETVDAPATSPAAEAGESPESELAPGSEPEADETVEADETSPADAERGPSRLGRGWLAGIAAALVLLAGGLGAGGYFALHYHHENQVIERDDAAAVKAAVDCVAATQAPDPQAMAASAQKIIDCGTDAYRAQALLYAGQLVQAYQAANIHLQVSDVRAAVERRNDDGSIAVLVALRVKVSSDQSQNETGYRLKATMVFAEGQYKISKLDSVTK